MFLLVQILNVLESQKIILTLYRDFEKKKRFESLSQIILDIQQEQRHQDQWWEDPQHPPSAL